MEINQNFANALASLGSNAGARIANAARPPANYLFNTFLPERQMPDYHVDASEMIVRSTMAGLVGMDSPFPPSGVVEVGAFLEQSAKLAISSNLNEASIRRLQSMMRQMLDSGRLEEGRAALRESQALSEEEGNSFTQSHTVFGWGPDSLRSVKPSKFPSDTCS